MKPRIDKSEAAADSEGSNAAEPAHGRSDGQTDIPPHLDPIQQISLNQAALVASMSDLTGHSRWMGQQIAQLMELVNSSCGQLLHSDISLQQELRKFQTGGPQRAMASVFHKLFRDFIRHITQLDDMVALSERTELTNEARSWADSVRIARDHFESILREWGCLPVTVRVGSDQFDPEFHEAAPAPPDRITPAVPSNIITHVCRRGWQLHEQILQYPLVILD